MAKGSDDLYHELKDTVADAGAAVRVKRVGCVGMCHRTPLIEINVPGQKGALYAELPVGQARELVLRHFRPRGWRRKLSRWWNRALDSVLLEGTEDRIADRTMDAREPAVAAFLDRQIHIATEHFGDADPLDLEEYVAHGGFTALGRCLGAETFSGGSPRFSREQVISLIEQSGLRGRGGAGFPTATKWKLAAAQTVGNQVRDLQR